MKSNTSSGPDEISVFLLKKFHTFVVEPLCFILNLIFTSGVVPFRLKESTATPIFETGDKKRYQLQANNCNKENNILSDTQF